MKTGLQNEEFLQRIKESGSLALKGKNSQGVNIFSGSVTDDGVISGKLIRPQYNVSELIKSVDVEITELIGREGPSTGSFVTRSLYEEQLSFNEELSNQLQTASLEINSLESSVQELQAITQSLRVELDGLELTNETLDSQLSSTQTTFSTASSDLQTALQNSTQEAIERVSLSARNESLRQEIEALREQLFGRQAQLSAGAQSSGNLITVNPTPTGNATKSRFFGKQEYRVGGLGKNFKENYQIDVINGKQVSVLNFSNDRVTVRINQESHHGSPWLTLSPKEFTLEPNESRDIRVSTNKDWTKSKYSESGTGTVTFTATSGEDKQTEVFSAEIDRGRR